MNKIEKVVYPVGKRESHKVILSIPVENLIFKYFGLEEKNYNGERKEKAIFKVHNKTKEIISLNSDYGLIIVPAKNSHEFYKKNQIYKMNGTIVHYEGFEKGILFTDEYEEYFGECVDFPLHEKRVEPLRKVFVKYNAKKELFHLDPNTWKITQPSKTSILVRLNKDQKKELTEDSEYFLDGKFEYRTNEKFALFRLISKEKISPGDKKIKSKVLV